MAHVIAERVSLNFPLYSPAQVQEVTGGAMDDERIIKSPSGKIIGVRALQGVSLSIAEGERIALIGRNGSGKTTLLQVLAGIISPDQGSVTVQGKSTNIINLSLGVAPEATGHENITLRGLAAGHSRAAIEERRGQIAEFSELGEFLSMPVRTYSSGMMMRLSFATATAFDPEILILDEWLSAGDLAFRQKANGRMREFAAKAGILVLASHSDTLIQNVCSRTIWLDRGTIHADGPTDEVLGAYRERERELAEQERQKENAKKQ